MKRRFNESVRSLAKVARASRMALVRSLEKRHPGMVVFTEPFLIQHPDLGKRRQEIEACTAIKEELIKAQVAVQVVLTSAGAYVLRSKEGLHNDVRCHKDEIKALIPGRAPCWGSRKGDS